MALPLVRRGLGHYWRVHAAVVLGVATASAVLGGALLVGESVRASLRDLALQRLGGVSHTVRSSGFFREALASDLARELRVGSAPVIAAFGVVTAEESGRRASQVRVLGVDERFFALQGRPAAGPRGREALLSPALAAELNAASAATLLVTVEKPATIPSSSLFGRRDGLARALRLSVAGVLAAADAGEFSLEARQQASRTVFVPLALLQRTIEQPGRVDTILLGEGATPADVARAVRGTATLADLGVRVRATSDGASVAIESDTGLVSDALAAAASPDPSRGGVLVYLANAMRSGAREVPYSVVAAVDDGVLAGWGVRPLAEGALPIVLNDWTARQLGARTGDRVDLDYYLWREEGTLETASAAFTVAAIIPMTGLAGDADLVPEYPGITTAQHLADWDPPFPLDLARVRPVDEEYWERHRATPKAFIPIAAGQRLWGHRLGRFTSLRIAGGTDPAAAAATLRRRLDPLSLGFVVDPVRERALLSSQGATDFGAYFTYFSAFLVASALLLGALFFRLGLEQRAPEIGLLRAVGFGPGRVRRLFLGEALVLALVGAALGALGAAGWAAVLMTGLRTWWVDAVGTRALTLHLARAPLLIGAAITVACALGCAAWTLRDLARSSPRALMAGSVARREAGPRGWWLAAVMAGLAVAVGVAAAAGRIALVPGFFGGAILLLGASLAATRTWLGRAPAAARTRTGLAGVAWLGLRGAGYRPGRSTLCVALIAFATFLVVAVGAFRRDAFAETGRGTGSGGYGLIAESLIPIHHDLATAQGRAELGLDGPWPVRRVGRFHVREGDDASCLNLYAPRNPRIVAPEARFVAEGGFRFRGTLAGTDEINPWRLLEQDDAERPVPVIADAASMEYVLHRALGDEIVIERPGAAPIRMRIVAALEDSVFQSEIVMGEAAFRRLFPGQIGYRLFLLDVAAADEAQVVTRLESALGDQGLDAATTRDRLAAYHRVENTYLSTFQALGGLGLLLGTVGLGSVLLRNALERRREIALLRALGYRPGHVSGMLLAENAALLAMGVGAGLVTALVAVVPAVLQRGGVLPAPAIAAVAGAVVVTGLVTSVLAARLVRRSPLLAALRSE